MLLLVAIYGPLAAPHDVYYARSLFNGAAPPFGPSPEYPIGSDQVGHDRLSWLLIGARGTMAIALGAAFLRVAIGASLGVFAGFRNGHVSAIVRRLALALSSVPATVAALLAVVALGVGQAQFAVALGLVGWAEPFHQARRYARSEASRPFIESARSIGVSDRRLVIRHLLPNLAPALLTSAAFQVSAVLFILGELALLNFFAGGSIVVDFDPSGRPIVAPAQPNWASMLGTTRPIISLYGDLPGVLLPCGALLAAVVATNLLGDALAQRAQRLDLYRLFSRRQVAAVALLTAGVFLPVTIWPNRLAAELRYARDFDDLSARTTAQTLASSEFGRRTTGTAGAERAAAFLAAQMSGQVVRGTEEHTAVSDVALEIDGRPVTLANSMVLSIDEAAVSGPLLQVDGSLLLGRNARLVAGSVVVVEASSPFLLGLHVQRASAATAVAVIALDRQQANFVRQSELYPLPVVRMTPAELSSALGKPLPLVGPSSSSHERLADSAMLRIRIARESAPIANVVSRVPNRFDGQPIVVVAAAYDTPPNSAANWTTATSAALLVGVVRRLSEAPLAVNVLAIATSTDHLNFAGLRHALASLPAEERSRVLAVVLIGPVLSDALVVETQTDPSLPSGTGRLAARLRDATGIAMNADPAGDLLRAIQSVRASAPPIAFSAAGADAMPTLETFLRAGRHVLAACAYVPAHLDEMR